MTNDLADLHTGALASCRTAVTGIGAAQWSGPTPCAGWDVRALVNHVVAGNWWAAELAAGRTIADVGSRLDDDVLGDDPLDAYDRSAAAADAAFRAPGAMDAPCAVSYGPVPGAVYCGHRFVDVLIHGWDISSATGRDAQLDPGLVAACLAVVRPQAELLTASGMFGHSIEVDADAGPQTVLLAMLGRTG